MEITRGYVAMNILMIDELPIYIHGMKIELKRVMPECTVFATNSFEDAQVILASTPINIILLDGEMKCSDFIQSLTSNWPTLPIVVMLRKTTDRIFNFYIRQNVKGIFTKELPVEKISQILSMVASGVVCFPEQAVVHREQPVSTLPIHSLSRRQQEVLKLLANGGTNKQISRQLNISAGTVKVHLESIFHRLQVNNRTQAAMLYFKYIAN
jgi:DNA-binding NarL/FixJ family response regulator